MSMRRTSRDRAADPAKFPAGGGTTMAHGSKTDTARNIQLYRAALPHMRGKVMSVLGLLVISAVLLAGATYAWVTLSTAPEVTGVTTSLSANGALEIALSSGDAINAYVSGDTDTFSALTGDYVGSSNEVTSVLVSNQSWGNIVILSDDFYTVNSAVLRPSVYDYEDGSVKAATYGADGRIDDVMALWESYDECTDMTIFYDGDTADAGYAYSFGLFFRTNAENSSLQLATAGRQRVYDETIWEAALGEGSYMSFTAGSGTSTEQLKNMMGAIRLVFRNEYDYNNVYAYAKLDMDGDSVTVDEDTGAVTALLYLYDEETGELLEDDAAICDFGKDDGEFGLIRYVNVLVYLDGTETDNGDAGTQFPGMTGTLNLQFSSSAKLEPANNDGLYNLEEATLSDVAADGLCGQKLIWSYEDGVLTISGTGDMYDYSLENDRPWEAYENKITKVVIEGEVTSIGNWAFEGCIALESITIPDSVTSIGSYAFGNCLALASVVVPDGVTSIESDAFFNCESLTSITIPDSVTSIEASAFEWCSSLTSITIPNSVTSIKSYAFDSCYALTGITIPDSVTSIGNGAFAACRSLTAIDVGGENAAYCSEDGVLYSKDMTTLVCYPAGKTDSTFEIPDGVTSIGSYAFYGCTALTSIIISDSVTSIGSYAFGNCDALTNVTITDNVTSIGSFAFGYCDSLTSITIPNGVTSIGGRAFEDCTSLTEINVAEDNAAYCSEDGVLYSKDMTTLVCYPAGKTDSTFEIPDSVASIERYAFYRCIALTSVTIPNGVTEIGDYAFYGCRALTSITIPSSVTSIRSYAFYLCTSLTSVTIPDSVTSIEPCAFGWCSSLTSITIPNSVTSIESNAFCRCNALTSVTIPVSVTSIGTDAFRETSLAVINYCGSEAEWKAISKEETEFAGITINYNYTETETE